MAAAAVSSNGANSVTNSLNTSNLMRNGLNAPNNTSPISAGGMSSLNSAGNSVCSSLSSNNGSTSLKLMLNQTTNSASANLLSPSSAPGENLLGDINYLSELFNNTSLSPILGHSASSLNSSSPNLNCGGLLNGSSTLNTMNAIKPNANRFNPTPTSFLDFNATGFGQSYNNVIGSKPTADQFNQTQQDANGQPANDRNQPTSLTGQQPNQQANQQQPNNQNASKSSGNNEQFNDSYSMSNGVIYPNQYQHLLVAN